jgi:hypothetical protein
MKYAGRKDKAAQAKVSGARKVTTWETKMEQPPLWYMEEFEAKMKLGKARINKTQLVTEVRDALTAPKYEVPEDFMDRLEWLIALQQKAMSFTFVDPDMVDESFPHEVLQQVEDAVREIEKATAEVIKKTDNAVEVIQFVESRGLDPAKNSRALDAMQSIEKVIEKGTGVGVSRVVLSDAKEIVNRAGNVGSYAKAMQMLNVALEQVFTWKMDPKERLADIEEAILATKKACEALNTQPPTEMSVAMAHVPWLKL